MHTRNQNKPPLTTGYNVSRSCSNKSENLDESQLNRRQKIGGGNMGRMNDLRNYIKRLKSYNTHETYHVPIKAQEKEAEARAASENLHYGLMEDLEKATQEINHLNSQADAIKNGDTISKLQKEKNALVEIITRLTDQASLLRNQLENMRVCIFVYGQTGSAKTYTMMGKPEAPEQKGLIPRSLEQIFETSQSLQCQGWTYKIQASMIKIYNETIRDLLSPNRSTSSCLTLLNKQYTIKHDSVGNTHVPDLTVVDMCSIKEISFLLDQAARSRPRNDIFKVF
ncbi:hypothetical protein HPP92_006574 [Vanilla planifolia]|uniref:Kinesin motor domain-containing protein n=1 Tax=Vanilla planifolia TaxID=51239 RepID=A0A835RJC5_VANPL|nr:hypothetical protein HPP92_006574 [Vanilla planifolia]